MKRLTRSQRVLLGVLAVALLALAYDAYQRHAGPRQARGGQAGAELAPGSLRSRQDVDALIRRLTTAQYAPVSSDLDDTMRDPFTPTPWMARAYAPPAPEPAEAEEAARAAAEARPQPFEKAHRLSAVLLGRTPLAVIDDRLVSVNARVDGHRVVEIGRDRVVLENLATGARVVLELSQEDRD